MQLRRNDASSVKFASMVGRREASMIEVYLEAMLVCSTKVTYSNQVQVSASLACIAWTATEIRILRVIL